MADDAIKDTVNVNREEYDKMRDRINELEDKGHAPIYDVLHKPVNKTGWLWIAPEYFSRWRLFPRAFISMYIYLLYEVTTWFMALPEPTMEQAGLVSVVTGAGAAWFGLYVNSTSSNHNEPVVIHEQRGGWDQQPASKKK